MSGWARNTPDGTVEVVLEGADDAVEGMVAFLRDGPGHASVARVEVVSEPPQGLQGFSVR